MEYIHPFLYSMLNDWKGHIASICSTYIIHDAFISYLLAAQLQLAAVLGLLLATVKYFSDKAEFFLFLDLDFFLEVLGEKCRFYNKKTA